MSRTFVTTDTHGELERLKTVLKEAEFNFEKDTLIHLGDVVDRGPDSYGVVELLFQVKNLISIRGNHDEWFLSYINTGCVIHPAPEYAVETLQSYMIPNNMDEHACYVIPETHKKFFKEQRNYYIDKDNRMFVHAGYYRDVKIEDQNNSNLYWDRQFFEDAMSTPRERLRDVNGFKQVFIGHTPTIFWKKGGLKIIKPIYAAQVINCDTGAVFGGKLSLLDITTDKHILYQS